MMYKLRVRCDIWQLVVKTQRAVVLEIWN